MIVLLVNLEFDPRVADPEELLARYATLTGWADALLAAGVERVAVLQRFRRDVAITRRNIEYVFASALVPMRRTIRRVKPDLVHVNGLGFPIETVVLRIFLPRRAALVVEDHASGAPSTVASVHRYVRRGLLRCVDGFLFTALEQAEPWRTAGLIGAEQRVYAVPEASTALTPIQRQAARQMSRVAGNPAVLWVGRLNANKDPLTVLDGFERSLGQLPAAGLTMVFGDDDLIRDVRARIEQSPTLGRHASLVGRVPHHLMAAFYSAADLFVLGSHHEGSGYALIEALACGAVPVVTNIPSFRAITGNGSIGALWTAGDASSFSAALVTTAERDLVSERARVTEEFRRRLSWPAVGRQALAAYADVIARRAVH